MILLGQAAAENARKQHDYTPFVQQFLKILQKRKSLVDDVRALAAATPANKNKRGGQGGAGDGGGNNNARKKPRKKK